MSKGKRVEKEEKPEYKRLRKEKRQDMAGREKRKQAKGGTKSQKMA